MRITYWLYRPGLGWERVERTAGAAEIAAASSIRLSLEDDPALVPLETLPGETTTLPAGGGAALAVVGSLAPGDLIRASRRNCRSSRSSSASRNQQLGRSGGKDVPNTFFDQAIAVPERIPGQIHSDDGRQHGIGRAPLPSTVLWTM